MLQKLNQMSSDAASETSILILLRAFDCPQLTADILAHNLILDLPFWSIREEIFKNRNCDLSKPLSP